jgi:xanthine dehydrogenase YagS FAD-binding subunit
VRDRASYAFALVSVAAIVDIANGTVRSARLAFGGLAHKPWRVDGAEQMLAGASAGKASFEAAANEVLKGAKGQGSNDFKITLTRRVLAGVLDEAMQSAGGRP